MNIKQFAQQAIENGYTGLGCNGWKWLKTNIAELDHIFQTEHYKQQNGMKYLCMPLIIGEKELTELEKKALETAWYLNNTRTREAKIQEYVSKMLADNWINLNEEIVKKAFEEKKKLWVIAKISSDWMSQKIDNIYKPYVNKDGSLIMLMKPKARSRGYNLHHFENAYCKII